MSVRCLSRVFYEVQDCSPAEKMVLLVLADHADEKHGRCWPGVERIALMASMSPRSVIRILQILEQKNQLVIYRNQGRKGTNCYALTCMSGAKSAPPSAQEIAEREGYEDRETAAVREELEHFAQGGDKLSPPTETLGNQPPQVTNCQGDDKLSPCQPRSPLSPEPSGTVRIRSKEEGPPPSSPSLEEVLQEAQAVGIPEPWARAHYQIRNGVWSPDWRRAMRRLYVKNQQAPVNGAARPALTQKAGGPDERWKIEKDLAAVRKRLDEHVLLNWPANVPVPPERQEDFDALVSKRLELEAALRKEPTP